jgi:dienelactone hydrolase
MTTSNQLGNTPGPGTYDPFRRGAFPVGVKTSTWTSSGRDRDMVVEIWYPAAAAHRGDDLDATKQDVFPAVWLNGGRDGDNSRAQARQAAVRGAAPESGEWPLILLVHGLAGFRRESTFLATHLASRGYVVVSPDLSPSTNDEVEALMAAAGGRTEPWHEALSQMLAARRAAIPFLVRKATESLSVTAGPAGITGASMGGWTSLMAPSVEPRIGAIAPMCPSGGSTPRYRDGNPMLLTRELEWERDVPTLMMVADRDSLSPLWGQFELFRRVRGPARLAILMNADHNHFVDDIEVAQRWLARWVRDMSEAFGPDGSRWDWCVEVIEPPEKLCPPDHAHRAWTGLATAHFDAYLRGSDEASRYLATEAPTELHAHGIELELISHAG